MTIKRASAAHRYLARDLAPVAAARIGTATEAAMGIELYNRDEHACVLFTHLVDEDAGEAVQANQCLIVDHGRGMLLDPGGNMTYNELFIAMSRFFPPKQLEYLFASHADPDIIASLQRWLTASDTRLVISRIWSRFVPHFCGSGKTEGRIIPVPDRGGTLKLGASRLLLLPAHFLHSEGNLQVYDPVSRILFSGDLGASMLGAAAAARVVDDLAAHIPAMLGFHRRYMVSNRVCRLWAQMVSALDIEMIVPQHGAPMRGRAVPQFIDWVRELDCGIDLVNQDSYRLPDAAWKLESQPQHGQLSAA
jgi:flavorubredoxin